MRTQPTYKVTFPFMPEIGTFAPIIVRQGMMETKEEAALWHLNSARRHDNLPELAKLPRGVKFQRQSPTHPRA